ncbi:MAG: DUF6338 family protein [Candidatus Nitrosopumilus sp. bin_68KS]
MADFTPEIIQDIASAVAKELSKTPDAAASLGTVSDIWVFLVLIIPGFITLKIITWFLKDEVSLTQFLYTVYSLIGSVGLIVLLANLGIDGVDITSIDQIRTHATNPDIIAILFGLAIGIGIAVGVTIRFTIYKDKFAGSAWDEFVKRNVSNYVKIHAVYNNGSHILSGYIKTASTGNKEKKELTLGEPAEWENDAWTYLEEQTPSIKELYLSEDSIKRIDLYTPIHNT